MYERNSDIERNNKNKLIEQIYRNIVYDAREQAKIITTDLISYNLNAFKFTDTKLLEQNKDVVTNMLNNPITDYHITKP